MSKDDKKQDKFIIYENCDIAIAMSSSHADPVLGLNILSYCPGGGIQIYKPMLLPSHCTEIIRLHHVTYRHTHRRTQPFIVKDIRDTALAKLTGGI